MSIEEQTISRLTETYAEAQSTQAGPGRDQAAHGRPSLLCTEMLDLQRNLLQQQQSNPVPDRVSLHEKLYLHLADEQITDAEALLTFRRRLQAMFYPDYADTLSVQVLLANLSDVRRQYLQDWIDRVESMGRYDSEDKEWLEYRLVHADLHCRRVHDELRARKRSGSFNSTRATKNGRMARSEPDAASNSRCRSGSGAAWPPWQMLSLASPIL